MREGWTREKLLAGIDYILVSGGGSIWRQLTLVRRRNRVEIEQKPK